MSRSYRSYPGLSHTMSRAKVSESFKKMERRRLRSAMSGLDEEEMEYGKKCHRANRFDRCVADGVDESVVSRRSKGYKAARLNHKLRGK